MNIRLSIKKIAANSSTLAVSALLVGTALASVAATEPRPETVRKSPIALNPALASSGGSVYEAFLSPQQEGGEERDTPAPIPSTFRSTGPSVDREKRPDRGHSVIEFSKDLSRAYVHLAVKNVKLNEIVMLHLHCGRPGQLGPILLDFSLLGDLKKYLSDGVLNIEVKNEDIVNTLAHGHGALAALTVGCPIVQTIPNDRVKTIAGMQAIANSGELYFNLHTKGQTYFGDIRGQFAPVARK